ncbi:hypothetical protein EOI86_08485 [Hwanghaeella grinnelliae]|uniref:Lipoprotein n=1 Tax=Hwanghaeella grinnelliae TaxID=2500179 RepID=A0A437QXM6_9PROT|nr:hypothetical protein [Hwanghaeella grinnelliae]RVU39264.1 hypothetical protein EOI86_08485 [Hwanghaeella grinnelliae]
MNRLQFLAMALALAVLTGCVNTPVPYMVYGERYHPGYDFGELQYYNGDKEMAVEVFNAPFEPSLDPAQRIALSMRGKNRGARIAFTAEPGPLTPKQTKVIIAFDMKPTDDGYGYCGGNPPGDAKSADDGRMMMVMVYCKRNAFVSSVRARMARPETPDDPTFQSMLAETTRKLLPRPLPLYDDNQREETRRLFEILGY